MASHIESKVTYTATEFCLSMIKLNQNSQSLMPLPDHSARLCTIELLSVMAQMRFVSTNHLHLRNLYLNPPM